MVCVVFATHTTGQGNIKQNEREKKAWMQLSDRFFFGHRNTTHRERGGVLPAESPKPAVREVISIIMTARGRSYE